jgi:hypothetical protein
MRRPRLPARVLPLVRLVGPYGWVAAGLVAGALLAAAYVRRTRTFTGAEDLAVSQWETDGGFAHDWSR